MSSDRLVILSVHQTLPIWVIRGQVAGILYGVALFSLPKVPLGNAENYGVRPR